MENKGISPADEQLQKSSKKSLGNLKKIFTASKRYPIHYQVCEGNDRALRLKMKALEMSTEDRIRQASQEHSEPAAYMSRATFSPRETCNVPPKNIMTPKALSVHQPSQSQVNDVKENNKMTNSTTIASNHKQSMRRVIDNINNAKQLGQLREAATVSVSNRELQGHRDSTAFMTRRSLQIMTDPASVGLGIKEKSGEGYVPEHYDTQNVVQSQGLGTTRGVARSSKLAFSPMSTNARMGEHASVAVMQLASHREPTRKLLARRMNFLNQSGGIFASTKSSQEQHEYEQRMAEIRNGYVRNNSNMLSKQMSLRMRGYANFDGTLKSSFHFSPAASKYNKAPALQPAGMQAARYAGIPKLSLGKTSVDFNAEQTDRTAEGDSLEQIGDVHVEISTTRADARPGTKDVVCARTSVDSLIQQVYQPATSRGKRENHLVGIETSSATSVKLIGDTEQSVQQHLNAFESLTGEDSTLQQPSQGTVIRGDFQTRNHLKQIVQSQSPGGREWLQKQKEAFIADMLVKQSESTYGLPTLAGSITSKGNPRTGERFLNTNLLNNTPADCVVEISTSEDFKMVKRRRKAKLIDSYLQQAQEMSSLHGSKMRNSVGSLPRLTFNNPNKMNIDRAVYGGNNSGSLGMHLQANQLNKLFNSSTSSAAFLSPVQCKASVMSNASNHVKIVNKNRLKAQIRRSPRESQLVTTQVLITAVDQQSQQMNGSLVEPSKSLSKNESLSKVSHMRKSTNEQPPEYLSSVSKASPSGAKRYESTSEQPAGGIESTTVNLNLTTFEDVHAEHYYLTSNFNDIMADLEKIAKERQSNNVVLKEVERMVASEPNGRALAIDIMAYINRRAMQDAGQECYLNQKCLVQKIALRFLRQIHGDKVRDLSSITAAAGVKGQHVCRHSMTEEDVQMVYLSEYKRFLQFRQALRDALNKKSISRETLYAHLSKNVEKLKGLTQAEKRTLSTPAGINQLLDNPLIGIVTESKETEEQDEELEEVPRTVSPGKKTLGSAQTLVLRKATNSLMQAVGAAFAEEQLESNKQFIANRLNLALCTQVKDANRKKRLEKAISRRETYQELGQLIAQSDRDAMLAQDEEHLTLRVQQTTMDSGHDKQNCFQEKRIKNALEVFRLKTVKQFQEHEVLCSLQPRSKPYVWKDPAQMEEEDRSDRQQLVGIIDENLSDSIYKFFERLAEQAKLLDEIKAQAMPETLLSDQSRHAEPGPPIEIDAKPKSPGKNDAETTTLDAIAEDGLGQSGGRVRKKNIFQEVDLNEQFYNQAKREIAGFNREPTQDSKFFKSCKASGVLPRPVFTCIKDNELSYQGRRIGMEYATALAEYIKLNKRQDHHILKLHFDDCSMKDEEFAVILKAIRECDLGVSLQNLTYSNNEIGAASVREISHMLYQSYELGRARCLKSICLANVSCKQPRELRTLFTALAENGSLLNSLKIQQVNLNDPCVIEELCNFICGNQSLMTLQLSACHLQAKHLVDVANCLPDCQNLRVLDLSDNTVSELVPENQIKQAQFLFQLAEYLQSSHTHLYSLNLQGLLLGSKLVPFMESVRANKTLMQVNLTNNLLTMDDEQRISVKLSGARNSDDVQEAETPYEHMLERFDMCYQLQLNKFKAQHLVQDVPHKQGKPTQMAAIDVFNSIVNAGIMKDLRTNYNLQKKMSTHSQVGEVFGNMGSTKISKLLVSEQLDSSVDRIYLRRNIGFNEMIFNELGKDLLSEFDYDRPNRWQMLQRDPKSPNWLKDIGEHQYVVIHADLENLGQTFEEVTDENLRDLLKNFYSLHAFDKILDRNQQRSTSIPLVELSVETTETASRNGQQLLVNDDTTHNIKPTSPALRYPIVFGTFTEWRAMQMLRTYQVTSILSTSSKEDREALEHYVFDEQNFDLHKHFKSVHQQTFHILKAIVQLHNAQVIGSPVSSDPAHLQKTFTFCGFCQPGRHSIFIYDPVSDAFYKKIIAVEAQANFINRQGLLEQSGSAINNVKEDLTPAQLKLQQKQYQRFLQMLKKYKHKKDETLVYERRGRKDILECFMGDSQPSTLQLQLSVLDAQLVEPVMSVIVQRYEQLIALHKELQSECHETYPLINFTYLRSFCQQVGFCSVELLDSTIVETEDKEESDDDEPVKKINSRFERMDRSRFINFVIFVWVNEHCRSVSSQEKVYKSFDKFVETLIVPLVPQAVDPESDDTLRAFLRVPRNNLLLRTFLQDLSKNSELPTPAAMIALFIESARIPISRYNLRKFYALSKKPVALEQAELGSKRAGAYFTLDLDEMIQFIWRIAQYVYSPESYGIEPASSTVVASPERAQEDGGSPSRVDDSTKVPDMISSMFEKSKFGKFVHVLEAVLDVKGTVDKCGLGSLIYKREDGTGEAEEDSAEMDIASSIAQCLPEREAKEFRSRID